MVKGDYYSNRVAAALSRVPWTSGWRNRTYHVARWGQLHCSCLVQPLEFRSFKMIGSVGIATITIPTSTLPKFMAMVKRTGRINAPSEDAPGLGSKGRCMSAA
jgi:hypothetical protein